MAIPIPDDVRQLLQAPNYVHLSTLRADGSPRNWVVWAGLEDDHILVCTRPRWTSTGNCTSWIAGSIAVARRMDQSALPTCHRSWLNCWHGSLKPARGGIAPAGTPKNRGAPRFPRPAERPPPPVQLRNADSTARSRWLVPEPGRTIRTTGLARHGRFKRALACKAEQALEPAVLEDQHQHAEGRA